MVSLSDATGASVAAYSYDAWGALTSSSEAFPGGANGWSNPYRYDGRDGTRYDTSDGLYWLSARVYDPTKRSAGREHGADVRNVGIHSAWPQVAATPAAEHAHSLRCWNIAHSNPFQTARTAGWYPLHDSEPYNVAR